MLSLSGLALHVHTVRLLLVQLQLPSASLFLLFIAPVKRALFTATGKGRDDRRMANVRTDTQTRRPPESAKVVRRSKHCVKALFLFFSVWKTLVLCVKVLFFFFVSFSSPSSSSRWWRRVTGWRSGMDPSSSVARRYMRGSWEKYCRCHFARTMPLTDFFLSKDIFPNTLLFRNKHSVQGKPQIEMQIWTDNRRAWSQINLNGLE